MWLFHTTSIYTVCMYHLQSNFSEISTCNNTAPRRPTNGTPADRGPRTFHMALAYFCDISSLLCNTVCVQVNLLSATYCLLPSMVFHSTIKFSKYVSSRIFALFLCHLEKYNYNRHSTTEYDNIAYNCSSNMPTNDNHSKTVIYNYF